jgi:plastocyanin
MIRITTFLLVVACCATASAYDVVQVAHPATVQGRVVLGSDVTIDRHHDSFASPELFGHNREIMRELKVDPEGGVAGALVVVIDPPRGRAPVPRDLELVNEDLAFRPRMQVATVGSDLAMVNRDEVFHNVHAFQHRRTLFNFALPKVDTVLHHKLRHPGLIAMQCDVGHDWMSAFVYVSSHPYVAVTDEKGQFRIAGLPPGEYRLAAWHEWIGELAPVTVEVTGTTEQDLVYHSNNRIAKPSPWLFGERGQGRR